MAETNPPAITRETIEELAAEARWLSSPDTRDEKEWVRRHNDWCERILDSADALLLAAEQGLEAGWRPISTAPKMKTILMWAATDIADDGRIRNWKMATGFWHSGYADHIDMSPWEWNGRQLAKYEVQPTHWMPLPAAPTPPTEAGEG